MRSFSQRIICWAIPLPFAVIVHAYPRDPFSTSDNVGENREAQMRIARIVAAIAAAVGLALAVGGTAQADPPAMTYNTMSTFMTYN